MYKRVNNSRSMVVAIIGIVLVMSIFTWLMYGISQSIHTMTETMVRLGHDVNTMTQVQKVMVHDIGVMTKNTTSMQNSAQNMNASMSRMGYDVGRSSRMFSSPMNYFWNMGQ
ncbi:MAG: hypothetical protein HOL37_05690 [Rhodospirillaceae bacterium]|nr:hypothetical protein [Rhodospirillaceae bacterium]MBT4219455.1 hypothetical protein [Rhodospirillaceae bacterium]MBT4464305.1 hypothetical protein [Rhodospirillaceae bacterium]MBT5014314.1 hypothetical protein [Rhodospirillaceae bacterium]MBT5308808.1 hypothetical protein [Rhodospirillaceae bacterium]